MNKLKIRVYYELKVYVNRAQLNRITVKKLGLKQYLVLLP